MVNKTCYIFAAGDYGELTVTPEEVAGGLIIAADAGYLYLQKQGIQPHMVVGDFDSMPDLWRQAASPADSPATRQPAPSGQPRIVRHPVMKDDTDVMLAVGEGLQYGCTEFILYGGLGGRLDHTYANTQILSYLASQNAIGFLVGSHITVTAIRNARLLFDSSYRGILSVFCVGDTAQGVCLSGLTYPLDNALLTYDVPLGVSNEFTGVPAQVLVKNGTLLVFWTHKGPLPGWQPYQP